jgi:hypothetical protein
MIDGSTYAFMLEIDGPGYVEDGSIDQILVPRMKKMPIKVSKFIILFKIVDELFILYLERCMCKLA